MRSLTLLLISALLVIAVSSPIVRRQEPVPIAPGVDIPLEAEQFLYPPDSSGAPEGTVWGTAGGKEVPLAPGVTIPLEEPQELKVWAEANVPLPDTTILLNVPRFSQNDPAWKNDVMQTCGQTIG